MERYLPDWLRILESKILVEKVSGRRFVLPDGSERFLVNEEMLIDKAAEVGGVFLEHIKTTNLQVCKFALSDDFSLVKNLKQFRKS
jgi:hypothetical protein